MLAERTPIADSLMRAGRGADFAARSNYLELVDQPSIEDPGHEQAEALLTASVGFLRFFLFSVCTHEALRDLGITTVDELLARTSDIAERVSLNAGLDFEEFVTSSPMHGQPVDWDEIPARIELPPTSHLLRKARTILAACPIEVIEEEASYLGREPEGHLCRRAYWSLEGYVRRNDPGQQQKLTLVGRKYAEGALSLADAATLLEMDTSDTIWWFERCGFVRSLDTIRLSDEGRTRTLARMREDRLRRKGEPEFSDGEVVREVISSERIEGVDVRPWIRSDHR